MVPLLLIAISDVLCRPMQNKAALPEERLPEQMYRSIDEVLVRKARRIEILWDFEDVFNPVSGSKAPGTVGIKRL